MSDYQNGYSYPIAELTRFTRTPILERVNCGLFGAPKAMQDFAILEQFLEEALTDGFPHPTWIEQTAFALLFSKFSGEAAVRLGPEFQISNQPLTDSTVAHHYVNDGSRAAHYATGLTRLLSRDLHPQK